MTLIAWAIRPDRAEIVTDSLGYSPKAADVIECTKCLHVPHLRCLVGGAGSNFVTIKYESWALAQKDSPELDQLAERSGPVLEDTYRRAVATNERIADMPTAIFLAGWSTVMDRAWGFVLGHDSGTVASWLPRSLLSFDMQGDRLPITEAAGWGVRPIPPQYRGMGADVNDMPSTVDDWVAVAVAARQQALDTEPAERILVGGTVTLSTLTRDEVTQRVIHRFDDTGEEFARMLAGTANPAGEPHKWTGVGRNDPCPCSSGKKYKQCHDPRATA